MDEIRDFIKIENAIKLLNNSNENECIHTIMSGFKRLDDMKQGWLDGEFCVIGGRPSIGKTGLILSIISNLVNDNIPVSIFTASDYLNRQFIQRILTYIHLSEKDYDISEKIDIFKLHNLSNIPLYLNFQGELTLNYIKENARVLVQNYGVKCIFIDKLQSIFNTETNGNTVEGGMLICHELKKLARELNIPIIIISDLKRSVEKHKDYIQLSDLYSNYAIENEADSILLLNRPEYYKIYMDERGNDLRGIMIIQIVKNRNRELGDVIYKFNHSYGTIEEFKTLDELYNE